VKDKQEIPKFHHAGNVKYMYGKLRGPVYKKSNSKNRESTEVSSLSDIHLINLNKENYELNINQIL